PDRHRPPPSHGRRHSPFGFRPPPHQTHLRHNSGRPVATRRARLVAPDPDSRTPDRRPFANRATRHFRRPVDRRTDGPAEHHRTRRRHLRTIRLGTGPVRRPRPGRPHTERASRPLPRNLRI